MDVGPKIAIANVADIQVAMIMSVDARDKLFTQLETNEDSALKKHIGELCDALLKVEPMERLGSAGDGLADVKAHPYFEHLNWDALMAPTEQKKVLNTGVASDTLKTIATAMTKLPEGFSVHRGIKRVYDARRKAIETGEGIDWGTAEALAFATLLKEGNHVRLSGQDVERGTVSHGPLTMAA